MRTSSIWGFSLLVLDFWIFFLHFSLPTMQSDIFAPVLSISLPSLHCWHVGPTSGLIFNLAAEHLGRTRPARWSQRCRVHGQDDAGRDQQHAPRRLKAPPLPTPMTPTRRRPRGPPCWRPCPCSRPNSVRRTTHNLPRRWTSGISSPKMVTWWFGRPGTRRWGRGPWWRRTRRHPWVLVALLPRRHPWGLAAAMRAGVASPSGGALSRWRHLWVLVALLRLGGRSALSYSRAHGPSQHPPTTALMGLNRGSAQHQDKERREEDRGKDICSVVLEKGNGETKSWNKKRIGKPPQG
jgi:hypothetical protein